MSGPRQPSGFWRLLAVFFATVSVGLAMVLLQIHGSGSEPLPPDDSIAPQLRLHPGVWEDLPGWQSASFDGFREAFSRSCRAMLAGDETRSLHRTGLGGNRSEWRAPCEAVGEAEGAAALRLAIETHFRPWAMSDLDRREGLLTGYYEASLQGARRPGRGYDTPLYRRPDDLIDVDLGSFRAELRGQRVAGRLSGRRLEPYEARRQFDDGVLAGRGLELVWVDDPVDAFFLHIQGSGRVLFEDASQMRVGYAGQNGHPYIPIGRVLVDRGELAVEEVSMQSIREWLDSHPEAAVELMQSNPSYVFFRELEGEGPLGSQGVALTGGASLAVDRSFLPMGVPIWLDGRAPAPEAGDDDLRLQRLMVAQDTGGAIRGPLRGDVFWGYGDEAREIAGRMQHPARMWLLLPRGQQPPRELVPTSGLESSATESPSPSAESG